MLQLAYS